MPHSMRRAECPFDLTTLGQCEPIGLAGGPWRPIRSRVIPTARAADPLHAIPQATSAAPGANAAGGAPEPTQYAVQARDARA